MPFVEAEPGVRLHYEESGSGRPIVFLYGFGGNTSWWRGQVRGLERRFRCISMDYRGHGASDTELASDCGIQHLAEDAGSLIRALDLNDAVLVGHSLGAMVATLTTLDFAAGRVARMASVAGSFPRATATEQEPWGMDATMARTVVEGVRADYSGTLEAMLPVFLHNGDAAILDELRTSLLRVSAEPAASLLTSAYACDLRDRLPELTLPTLLLHSRQDQIAAPRWTEYAAERLANCTTTWLDQSGHYPMLEEPDRVTESLAQFAGDD